MTRPAARLSIVDAAREAPETIALVDAASGRAWSFAELAAMAVSTTASAIDGAVPPPRPSPRRGREPIPRGVADPPPSPCGGRVGVGGPPRRERSGSSSPPVVVGTPTVETVVALYALWERGEPAVLVHPAATDEERRRAIDVAGAARDAAAGGDEIAAIVTTSGTTGAPKAVALSHRAFAASAAASAANLGWNDDDRWLCALPLAHVGGLSIVTRCLLARRCAVVWPGRFDAGAVAAVIARARVTVMSLVPAQLERLLAIGWRPPEHVRAVLVGGAATTRATRERAARAGIPLLVTYGMTETCSQVCTQAYATRGRAIDGVGAPLPGIRVDVAVDGRIRVAGDVLAEGAGPWHETGDLGWLDGDGVLHVRGRADDVIVSGGENVDPREVEAVIAACPGVSAVCVVGVADARWGETVVAAVVATADRAQIDRFAAEKLAGFKRPRRVAVVDALPLGRTGKVDRAAVRALITGRGGAHRSRAP